MQTAEIEPWREGVETWRVLRALFPSTIASHSAVQDFFFGEDLLLRRHDYNVDIAGGFAAAQLVFAYVEADGVKLPTQRRAYIRGPDHRPALDPLMVSIDISEVRFEQRSSLNHRRGRMVARGNTWPPLTKTATTQRRATPDRFGLAPETFDRRRHERLSASLYR